MSCTGVGQCTAVGYDRNNQPMHATESGGMWGTVTEVHGAAGGAGVFNAVSCAGVGQCTAVGDDNNNQPIYATESGGIWGTLTEVPGSAGGGGIFNGVSCTGVGQCTAVGDDNNAQPMYSSTRIEHLPDIFKVVLQACTSLHVGYHYFPAGIVVHWRVNQTGTGTLASGSFTTLGGGNTYHFLTAPLGVTLKPDSATSHTHVRFSWTIGTTTTNYTVTRDPGC